VRRVVLLAIGVLTPLPALAYDLKDCWQTKDSALEIAACTHFIDSGALNPDQLPKAYTGRGVGHARLGHYPEALADHAKAIELAPQYPLPYVNRGSAYSAMGDYHKAVTDFDAALKLNGDHVGALNNRAWALYKLGDAARALADADRAASLKPESAAIHDTRAHVLEALGRKDEAIEAFRRALASDASLASAAEGLARLGAAP
jgi:tetratricopeptide (TPR) repeat protein